MMTFLLFAPASTLVFYLSHVHGANFMLPKSLSGILSMLLLYMQLKTLSRS